jgi:hypothetical protein
VKIFVKINRQFKYKVKDYATAVKQQKSFKCCKQVTLRGLLFKIKVKFSSEAQTSEIMFLGDFVCGAENCYCPRFKAWRGLSFLHTANLQLKTKSMQESLAADEI